MSPASPGALGSVSGSPAPLIYVVCYLLFLQQFVDRVSLCMSSVRVDFPFLAQDTFQDTFFIEKFFVCLRCFPSMKCHLECFSFFFSGAIFVPFLPSWCCPLLWDICSFSYYIPFRRNYSIDSSTFCCVCERT